MAVRLKDRIEANIRQSDKVNSSLSIQLNSGTATVYDGSSAKTINVTPAAISAVNKSGDTMTGTLTLGSSTTSTAPGVGIHVHDLRDYTPSQDMFGSRQVNWYFYSVPNYGWRSIMHTKGWNGTYAAWDIAGPANNSLDTNFLLRSYYSTSTSDWLAILHSGNYTSYTVTKTGSGASGTWGINITGNAAKLGTSTVGSSTRPIYLSSGTATACSGRTVPGIKGASAVSTLGWGTNNNYIPDISLLAYWNGAYSTTNSNLAYCNKGAFGSIVTKNASDYLAISGGEITGRITKKGSSASWINGRDQALVALTTYSAYNAGLSMKTTNGSWEIGVYTSDNLWFTYASDANYNAGTNQVAQFRASSAGVIYGAAWNDYAEFRTTASAKAGEVVIENGDGTMHRSHKRLEPAASIVSDTYGFAIGETEKCGTPIAVAGRVLAYPYEDRYSYKAGDAVCSAPDGKVSKMTREEMIMYPDCIIGYISEIPGYEVWGQTDVPINGRIWIKV